MENNTTTEISLIDAVQTVLPNAYPMSFGALDPDSAVIEWGNCRIVITSLDHDGYDVGIYDVGQWEHGDDPTGFAAFPHDVARMVEMVDCLTNLQPEGTYWAAWAAQWLSDHPDRLTDV